MLGLLSKAWKLSIPATVTKLSNSHVYYPPELVDETLLNNYEEWTLERWKRYTDFWEANQNPWRMQQPEIQDILKKAKLRAETTSWQADGPGKILGAAHVHDIEVCQAPKAASANEQNKYGKKAGIANPSAGRIFTGAKWRYAAFFPFYSQPFRVSAWCCVGRDCDRSKDIRYKTVSPYGTKSKNPDFGLAFHPDILNHRRNDIYAFNDPFLYLRTHVESFYLEPEPLDIVCWGAQEKWRSRFAWRMFAGRKIYFWAPRLTAEGLIQAIQTDGYLCRAGIKALGPDEALDYAMEQDPGSLLKWMKRQAVHWTERLNFEIPRMEDHEIEELFLRMQLSGDKQAGILSKCDHTVRKRIQDLLQKSDATSVIIVDKSPIEERSEGWFRRGEAGEELISDGVLRIDRAVYHPRADKTYYQGRILYQGEEIPYSAPADEVEQKAFNWMKRLLVKEQKGLLRFNASWNNRLVTLATQFQKPKFSTGVDLVGWDSQKSAFILPTFRIEFGGQVLDHKDIIPDSHLPGAALPKPRPIEPGDTENWLAPTPANKEFWNAWLALVSNIVAPVFNHPYRGIATASDAATSVAGAAALACGCQVYPDVPFGDYADNEKAHTWPIVVKVSNEDRAKVKEPWLLEPLGRNCLVQVKPRYLSALRLSSGWHVINLHDSGHFNHSPELASSPLLTGYLQHLCQRHFEGVYTGGELILDIRNDVVEWLRAMHHDTTVIEEGEDSLMLAGDSGQADALGELLWLFLKQGHLKQLPESFPYETNCCWQATDPPGILVPKADLVQLILKNTRLLVSADRITEQLETDNALLGLCEHMGRDCWLIQGEWWRQALSRHAAAERPFRLRAV
jgi:hypothetical protein